MCVQSKSSFSRSHCCRSPSHILWVFTVNVTLPTRSVFLLLSLRLYGRWWWEYKTRVDVFLYWSVSDIQHWAHSWRKVVLSIRSVVLHRPFNHHYHNQKRRRIRPCKKWSTGGKKGEGRRKEEGLRRASWGAGGEMCAQDLSWFHRHQNAWRKERISCSSEYFSGEHHQEM